MSWVEKIQNGIIIITGDGNTYNPLYMFTKRRVEYNLSTFEFPNIKGTLVDRRLPKGTRYDLDIIFQGDDHLDVAENFRISLEDTRPITITHPMYGRIICHATSLEFDSTGINTTRITGEVIETITNNAPKTSIDPKDDINFRVNQFNQYTGNVESVSLSASEKVKFSSQINSVFNNSVSKVSDQLNFNDYLNEFNSFKSKLNDPLNKTSTIVLQAKSFLNYPSQLNASIRDRLNFIKSNIGSLRTQLGNVSTPNDKKVFETNSTSLITSLLSTAVNPLSELDYSNIVDVLFYIDVIFNSYNQFIEDLNTLQTDTGSELDSYIPDFDNVNGLENIVDNTLGNLMQIALGAKQERIFTCTEDTNLIILAHRLYGLTENDSTIDYLISTNNIAPNEYIQVLKGRKIKYYV